LLPAGYDIEIIDTDEFDGYKLYNPEGYCFLSKEVAKDISPGRIVLLQEAAETILEGYKHRSVLANEADWFYQRGRK
jgi:hypothetical protein